MGLTGFAIACVCGLLASNPGVTVLVHALVAMVVCQMLGWLAGEVLAHVVREHLLSHAAAHPIPELKTSAAGAEEIIEVDEVNDSTREKQGEDGPST